MGDGDGDGDGEWQVDNAPLKKHSTITFKCVPIDLVYKFCDN